MGNSPAPAGGTPRYLFYFPAFFCRNRSSLLVQADKSGNNINEKQRDMRKDILLLTFIFVLFGSILPASAQKKDKTLNITVVATTGENLSGQPVSVKQTDYDVAYSNVTLNAEGKVEFTTETDANGKTADQIYNIVYQYMSELTQQAVRLQRQAQCRPVHGQEQRGADMEHRSTGILR